MLTSTGDGERWGNFMMNQHQPRRGWTVAGLFIAMAGLPLLMGSYRLLVGAPASELPILLREGGVFLLLGALLWIVTRGERLPLSSVGLTINQPGRTALMGLGVSVALLAGTFAALGLIGALGLSYGGEAKGAFVTPIWLKLLIVLRAGLVEEIFYRGYAMDRLAALTGSRLVAALVPLAAFTLSHANGGIAGMLIALILGGILTGFYAWKRNLPAVILAHFLIDFIPNILLPLLGAD